MLSYPCIAVYLPLLSPEPDATGFGEASSCIFDSLLCLPEHHVSVALTGRRISIMK